MKIAVAVDGSENALRAAKHAIMLTQHLPEAELEVIYVADYNKAVGDRLLAQSPEGLVFRREQIIHPILELTKGSEMKLKTTILKGNPSREIIKYTNAGKFNQLVLGSRGLNIFQEMILGSVSHKVMKHVECPVTIVK